MARKLAVSVLLILAIGTPCFGQEWARKMFKAVDHDFGAVARGAKAEYKFVFENIYLEDIHVSGVRTSCGCTTPTILTPDLKTYEQGAILAHFNTDSFIGPRSATITVTFDKPFYAEVQLHVRGHIRSDVVIEPGSVQFGSIDAGIGYQQVASISHSGGNNWQIVDVKSPDSHITAKVEESGRSYGKVSYVLKVLVDKTTPPGYLNDHLMLVTNDASNPQIPVLVEGRIVPGISVSPATLFMGVVQPGQQVTKQLVVKGKKAFRILDITCEDQSFKFDTSKENAPKELHLIPVTFTASSDPGKVTKTIKIHTDQGDITPQLDAYAVIAAASQ